MKLRIGYRLVVAVVSLPVRGAWVEMLCALGYDCGDMRRSPCGERGLKFPASCAFCQCQLMSLPVRGAWVEIQMPCRGRGCRMSRSPCGERGLKYESRLPAAINSTVAPRAGSVG